MALFAAKRLATPLATVEEAEEEALLPEKQQLAAQQLRAALQASGARFKGRFPDETTILRFLRARNFHVDKSKLMFDNACTWRKDFGADTILTDFSFPEKVEVKKFYPQYHHKVDKMGRPVYVEQLGSLDLDRLLELTTMDRMMKYHVQEWEMLTDWKFPACSKAAGHPIYQSLTILDVQGVRMEMMTKKVRQFIKDLTRIDQDYYPEHMGRIIIINAPPVFKLIWQIVRIWLDKKTLRKIDVVGSKYEAKLLEHVDIDNLPQAFGGNCKCLGGCENLDAGPWKDQLYSKAPEPVLAASQTPGEKGSDWFQGTADAVRQYLWLFDDAKNKTVEDVVILAGDHLYRMDYMDFVQKHKDTNADITLAVLPVDDRQEFCSFPRASDFGLLNIDSEGRVIAFAEKPKGADLKKMEVDTTVLGLSAEDARKQKYIASMGIYVFKKEILQKLLRWRYPTANDFGGEIIPASAKEYNVQAYLFPDYWEDIGTIRSFFEANLALTAQPPKFRFYDPSKPIFTSPRFLPPTKVERCKVKDSILSHGCFLRDCSVTHSIVGIRQRLDSGVVIKDTMLSGADYYEVDEERAALLAAGKVPVGVGENTQITEAIVDKNARIGRNVVLINKDNIVEADRSSEGFYIRSGIIIVLKNATIHDNFVL
eukprot:SM000276S10303  [mRNA]  locus=s276:80317:89316:- [translate_table: standard]